MATDAVFRPWRVGVVEDDPDVRAYFAAAVGAADDLELAFAAGSLAEARSALADKTPDLCLVDLGLPDGRGVELIGEIKTGRTCRVLVATVLGDRRTVMEALTAGADGYVLKSADREELIGHVRRTLEGFTPISPQVASYLLEILRPAAGPGGGDDHGLTAREVEVLSVFARGLSYEETARTLAISPNTVRDFVKKIYAKLNVHNRAEAVFEARSLGLIDPPGGARG